jgi:hypothetical protein
MSQQDRQQQHTGLWKPVSVDISIGMTRACIVLLNNIATRARSKTLFRTRGLYSVKLHVCMYVWVEMNVRFSLERQVFPQLTTGEQTLGEKVTGGNETGRGGRILS